MLNLIIHGTVILILTFIVLFAFVYILYSVYAVSSAAPFVPIRKRNIQHLLLFDIISKKDVVLDLGSGDGRIVRAVAPYCRTVIGVEINPTLHYIARLLSWVRGIHNAVYYRKNLWEMDLSSIDILIVYFIPSKITKLQKKIEHEMKPGSIVVSNMFIFPGWNYSSKRDTVYVYER